jgi:hypothetical protein
MQKVTEMTMEQEISPDMPALQPVNVVVAYDTPVAHGAVTAMLDRIAARLREKPLFNVKALKFPVLEQMTRLGHAAVDMDAADLLVVAFGETGVPGAGVIRWIENWSARHAGQDAALGLVTIGKNTSLALQRFVQDLRHTASRHGLNFIAA